MRADEHEADEHHEPAEGEDDHAERQPEGLRRLLEHRVHEVRGGDEQEAGKADRQEADDVARQPLLSGQGPDLALDPDPLADGVRDRVEDLGEVAADGVLDVDGGRHQLQVVGPDAADHVLHRLLERQAEVDLADDAAELGRHRRPRLADDELDGLEERRAGPEAVGQQRDRVRQLLVERAQAAGLAAIQPEARQEEPEERADEQGERAAQRRQRQRRDDEQERQADDRADPDREELGRLELQVRPGDVAGKVRPEVALLDDLVQLGEGDALGQQVGDAARAARLGLAALASRGIPLEAGAHPGAAAGRRDADRDQEDRGGRDGGNGQGHGIHGSASSPLSS